MTMPPPVELAPPRIVRSRIVTFVPPGTDRADPDPLLLLRVGLPEPAVLMPMMVELPAA